MKPIDLLPAAIGLFALTAAVVPCSAVILKGDPEKGKAIAEQKCFGCHNQASSQGNPPRLDDIARMPHYSAERLRRIITVPPHHGMPVQNLSAGEVDDVAAYIRSLHKSAP